MNQVYTKPNENIMVHLRSVLYGKQNQANESCNAVCIAVYNLTNRLMNKELMFETYAGTKDVIKNTIDYILQNVPYNSSYSIHNVYILLTAGYNGYYSYQDNAKECIAVRQSEDSPKILYKIEPAAEKRDPSDRLKKIYQYMFGRQMQGVRANLGVCTLINRLIPTSEFISPKAIREYVLDSEDESDGLDHMLMVGYDNYLTWLNIINNNLQHELRCISDPKTNKHTFYYVVTDPKVAAEKEDMPFDGDELPYRMQAAMLCEEILNSIRVNHDAYQNEYALALCYAFEYLSNKVSKVKITPDNYMQIADSIADRYCDAMPVVIRNEFTDNRYGLALLSVRIGEGGQLE